MRMPAAVHTPEAGPAVAARPRWPACALAFWLLAAFCGSSVTRPAAPADPPPPVPPAAETLDALRAQLEAFLGQPRFASAQWGIHVVALDSGAPVFAHGADLLLKPASNAKLYTGALALDRLGPDHRIRTSLYARARPDRRGTVRGDVVVFGRGDPSLAARFHDGTTTNVLAPMVEALAAAGVRRIAGDLVGDDSFFRGPPYGTAWTWDDLQYYYGAEVSALTLEDNVVDLVFRPGLAPGAPCTLELHPPTAYLRFRNAVLTGPAEAPRRIDVHRPLAATEVRITGQLPLGGKELTNAVTVPRPALFFVTQLRAALAERGIRVSGGVRAFDWRARQEHPLDPTQWIELAAVESRPMGDIVVRMMKPSQNLYAQLLLLQVGARSSPHPVDTGAADAEPTTEAQGLRELRRFLADAGIPRGHALLEEGSGLSRGALVTPSATVGLLRFMDRHPHAQRFLEALPVAGVDGTLRHRLKDPATAGNVRAKTGTLRYVHTLSGYLTTAGGERLAFAIMLNAYADPEGRHPGRDQVDAVATMLARFRGRALLLGEGGTPRPRVEPAPSRLGHPARRRGTGSTPSPPS